MTPQHLLMNRNAMFEGGVRPHHYCLPVLKRERDREALVAAATGDDPRFFLGTDSAPHARHAKEAACGCAGSSPRTRARALRRVFEAAAGSIGSRPSRRSRRRLLRRAAQRGSTFRSSVPPGTCRRAILRRRRARAAAGAARSAGAVASERTLRRAAHRRPVPGFLPVAVDVETGGFHASSDALLELAAVMIEMGPGGELRPGTTFRYHVQPFHGSRIDPASLAVNGIDPHHPLRPAMPEKEALTQLFREVRKACGTRNARGRSWWATTRRSTSDSSTPRWPAPISSAIVPPVLELHTATLGGVALGQTVLSRAVAAAGLAWDPASAHSAIYDAERTLRVLHDLQPVPIHVRGSARASARARAGRRAATAED